MGQHRCRAKIAAQISLRVDYFMSEYRIKGDQIIVEKIGLVLALPWFVAMPRLYDTFH